MSFDRFYKPTHVEWRKKCRDFVEAEIMPNVSQWEKDKALPRDIYAKTADAGSLCSGIAVALNMLSFTGLFITKSERHLDIRIHERTYIIKFSRPLQSFSS